MEKPKSMRLTPRQREMLLLAAEDTRGFMYRWADTWRTGEALCARGLMQQGRNRAYEPGFYLTDEGRAAITALDRAREEVSRPKSR